MQRMRSVAELLAIPMQSLRLCVRLNDPFRPTNNATGLLLVTLVRALSEQGEPKADQTETLIM